MAKPKFTPFEIEFIKKEIADRYLQGEYQSEIAKNVVVNGKSLNQQAVSYYLVQVRDEWKKHYVMKIDEAKAQELAKIDKLERTYWAAWHRSLNPIKVKKSKKSNGNVTASNGNVTASNGNVTAEINEFDSVGEKKFLEGVQWCIEQRIKVLGINAPEKFEITNGYKITIGKRKSG